MVAGQTRDAVDVAMVEACEGKDTKDIGLQLALWCSI